MDDGYSTIARRLGNGTLSGSALRWFLGSTSNDGQELTADDDGRWGSDGPVRDHLNRADQVKPGRGNFNSNPEADYGPDAYGSRHLDSRGNLRKDRESKYFSSRSRWDQGPSAKRSIAVCDN